MVRSIYGVANVMPRPDLNFGIFGKYLRNMQNGSLVLIFDIKCQLLFKKYILGIWK